MEIERKFLLDTSTEIDFTQYQKKELSQYYISIFPTIRMRKQDDEYFLTIKSKGSIMREEYELSVTKEEYHSLLNKKEGTVIEKTRYFVPLPDGHIAEIDVFKSPFSPLITAEVEFSTIEEASDFLIPTYFGKEVTHDNKYKNANLAVNRP